ncbi:PilZ domain-containing protein [Sulfuritortus calidifontis]|uniref:Cyclic diguanosine monophosphate-binding protein n=1 Tax=Sulfuritortus calidifontis TaxID=1914471 RepID=A0A4R3JWR6_9PROT|nr:PilZ domain-containing protein [Sulfuritortus calidifontis]TCS71292.1 PilZ domain-containing protein [Sulfuritortus calidifontis]
MTTNSQDKRHFHRVAYDARVTLTAGGSLWAGTVQDISLKGCLVKLGRYWPVEAERSYHLSIHLSPVLNIEMDAVLAHQEGELVGFRCTRIDLDSITELRRLVELNLGDASLLDRDLHALIHA